MVGERGDSGNGPVGSCRDADEPWPWSESDSGHRMDKHQRRYELNPGYPGASPHPATASEDASQPGG